MSRPALAEQLDLSPHPEGGWYRRTWTGTRAAVTGPGSGSRRTASAIYYLLGPGERSRWHRVASDEVWLWHHGGPLELRLGGTGDRPVDDARRLVLGTGFDHGQRPQLVVPAGTWQSARPVEAACLVSCVVSPEFYFADFELFADGDES